MESSMFTILFALGSAVIGIIYAAWLAFWVKGLDGGTPEMKMIQAAIHEGASAYMARQFKTVAVVAAIIFVLLWAAGAWSAHFGLLTACGFLVGGTASAISGYVGMMVAVRANAKTAQAAHSGLNAALLVAFRGGAVTYTKAADVGADLVGKVEAGIPEDDPRNAAVIADNVGDNVGDCAGMAADLFESYEVTLVASLILGAAAFQGSEVGAIAGVMFPLFVRAVGVITSIIGILAVTPRREDEHGMRAINRGFFLSAAISAAAVFVISGIYMDDYRPAVAVLFGLILASIIQVLTQYFTDTKFKPVQEIAESTQTGPATTILSGFAIGLESTVWAVLIIAAAIAGAFVLGESTAEALYFISLTGMGMLTTGGVIVSR